MRDAIAQRLENADRLTRQFGCDEFTSNPQDWYPKRTEPSQRREPAPPVVTQPPRSIVCK